LEAEDLWVSSYAPSDFNAKSQKFGSEALCRRSYGGIEFEKYEPGATLYEKLYLEKNNNHLVKLIFYQGS
jgi:hypothetical protein